MAGALSQGRQRAGGLSLSAIPVLSDLFGFILFPQTDYFEKCQSSRNVLKHSTVSSPVPHPLYLNPQLLTPCHACSVSVCIIYETGLDSAPPPFFFTKSLETMMQT